MIAPDDFAWRTWGEPPVGDGDLEDWQEHRCACCGKFGPLVRDHCHETGLIRGLLCHGCNLDEARDLTGHFDAWRAGDHPANALRHLEVYVSSWGGATPFRPGSAMSYMSGAEIRAWYAQAADAYHAGGPFPTEVEWPAGLRDRLEAELRGRADEDDQPNDFRDLMDSFFGRKRNA